MSTTCALCGKKTTNGWRCRICECQCTDDMTDKMADYIRDPHQMDPALRDLDHELEEIEHTLLNIPIEELIEELVRRLRNEGKAIIILASKDHQPARVAHCA